MTRRRKPGHTYVPKALIKPGHTYVPKALMKPGWSADHPQSIANWSAERAVFTWIGQCWMSIEETIEFYEKCLNTPPRLQNAGAIRRFLSGLLDGKCHHGIPWCVKRCSECDQWHRECLVYLGELLRKVNAFCQSESFWLTLNPYDFEREVANLYGMLGWQAHVTPGSGDEGIDIILSRDGETAVVQCKKHSRPAGPAVARELLGAVTAFGADKGVLVCTGGFTESVQKLAAQNVIELVDLDMLVQMYNTVHTHR